MEDFDPNDFMILAGDSGVSVGKAIRRETAVVEIPEVPETLASSFGVPLGQDFEE